MLDGVADVLRALLLETPPNVGGGMHDLFRTWKVGGRLKRLSLAARRDLLDLFTKSAGDVLDQWFESAPIKAAFGFDAVVGNFASPYTPGLGVCAAASRLRRDQRQARTVGTRDRRHGRDHPGDGRGSARLAASRCSPTHPSRACSPATDARSGIALADGTEIAARRVVANVNPKLLYQQLIDAGALDADFRRRIDAYRCASATFRMNVALDALPDFSCQPGDGPHLRSGIIIAPSLDYMERAYFDARQHGWSREPIVEMLIPSTVDASLAPPGKHVASLFCQHANPELPDGRSWDEVKEQVADLMIATVDRHAPNFARSVIARRVLSPLDLEREFGLIGGDIFHGALSLDQLFSARPVLGNGHYRGPLKGLYMCGAGTHPGGGVTGVPGHNAAREILRDVRRKRR